MEYKRAQERLLAKERRWEEGRKVGRKGGKKKRRRSGRDGGRKREGTGKSIWGEIKQIKTMDPFQT